MQKTIIFQMSFTDTGCGISPKDQAKLFKNFSKLQEGQEYNKLGVGLGLSICREIIQAQGGSVDIISEEGKGTTFVINLKAISTINMNKIFSVIQMREDDSLESSHPSGQINEESDIVSECNSDEDLLQYVLNENEQEESKQDRAYDPLIDNFMQKRNYPLYSIEETS